jgi:hypothetical protein
MRGIIIKRGVCNKMKKIICLLLSVIMTLSVFSLATSAAMPEDNSVMPLYNNVISANCSLTIDSQTRVATVLIRYSGMSGISIEAEIISYMESYSESSGKWRRMDIGTTGDQWVDESTSRIFSNTHTTTIHYPGTYRAVAVFTISRSGGATDVITLTSEDTFP